MIHYISALYNHLMLYFSANSELGEIAVRCIALAGNVCPFLWPEYICDTSRATQVLKSVTCAVSRLFHLSKKAATAAANASRRGSYVGTYVGFDIRDIAEYGMQDMQDVVDAYNASAADDTATMEDIQTNSLVLLMFIGQCLSKENRYIAAEIEHYRAENLAGVDKSTVPFLSARDKANHAFVEGLLSSTRILADLLRNVKEDIYLSCIKAIACINCQFPPRVTETGAISFSTEVRNCLLNQHWFNA